MGKLLRLMGDGCFRRPLLRIGGVDKREEFSEEYDALCSLLMFRENEELLCSSLIVIEDMELLCSLLMLLSRKEEDRQAAYEAGLPKVRGLEVVELTAVVDTVLLELTDDEDTVFIIDDVNMEDPALGALDIAFL